MALAPNQKRRQPKAAKAAESALVSKSEPVVTAAQEPAIKKAIAKSEPVEPVEPVEQVKSVQEEIPSEKASVIVPSVEQAAIEEVSTKADATDDAQAVEVKSEVKSVKSEVKSVKSEVKSVKSEVKSVESEVKSVEIEATEPVEIEAVESVNPFEEMGLSPDVFESHRYCWLRNAVADSIGNRTFNIGWSRLDRSRRDRIGQNRRFRMATFVKGRPKTRSTANLGSRPNP